MFTRRKHNRSGTISVVVVDKSGGRFTEIHRIDTYGGQQLIDFECKAETELRTAEDVLSGIKSARLTAVQTIINKVYEATVDYLQRHFKNDVSLQKIYRYMDKLYNTHRERVQEISVRHTKQLFGGNIGILRPVQRRTVRGLHDDTNC